MVIFKKIIGVASLIMIIITSCSKNCTKEFCMLTVSLQYDENIPVLLDSFAVKCPEITLLYRFPEDFSGFDSIYRLQGIYILLSDSEIEMTSRRGTKFEFKGWLDNSPVVNENYMIGNDGCHIEFIQGDREIIIEKE